jgi:hypothetical protein
LGMRIRGYLVWDSIRLIESRLRVVTRGFGGVWATRCAAVAQSFADLHSPNMM